MIRRFFYTFFAFLLATAAVAQIQFNSSVPVVYLKGKDAASLPLNWMTDGYTPENWIPGNMPFRYGDGTGGTLLSDMQNNYSTVYLRSTFTASQIENLNDVRFSVNYDDGFILWINGEEALAINAPDSATYKSFSNGQHEFGDMESYQLPASDIELREGLNTVAIQCFNTSLESSDFYFELGISAELKQPQTSDTIKVVFSKPNGFYNQSFDLMLSVPDPAYDLLYTIDGSNPQTSLSAISGGKSATVRVDPNIAEGRPATPAFIVRASLVKDGLAPSFPLTQTYIFLDKVLTQVNPGGGWPTDDRINGQRIDLEMDPDVVNDPDFSGRMKESLTSIPSISVVTELTDLFDPVTGIYVNALLHGDGWERFSSVELIDPKGNPGFAINAGLRIRGGYSRNDNFPKHAFRLFFRGDYGAEKLKYPLFEEEGVGEFDKIDLRCEQNYSWAHPGDNKDRNTFVREVFSRDSQRDMGQPYTRSRYYHLYLNGMYWGLYQTQERAEARFASDYFGGSKEDYDVVKVNTSANYVIEATDGNLDSWNRLYSMCVKGFENNADYFALEGKDQFGYPTKGGEVMVDIDDLIDYMQLIFYTGNFDAPVSAFISNNSGPNNFYAIDRRDDRSSGFVFFAHDSEHSLMYTPEGPGIGLNENRVTIPNMRVSGSSKFHPQWLHYKLSANKEYRQRFGDRVYQNFFNGGVFTPEVVTARFEKRVRQVENAVIAESARWGDTQREIPYTYTDWYTEIINVETQLFPYRTDIVIGQMTQAGLYLAITPPIFTKDGSKLNPGKYTVSGNYQINLFASSQIYYTLDGSDPRLADDQINPAAQTIVSGGKLDLNGTAIVKARAKNGTRWSALASVTFLNPNEDLANLKVTELNYHPTDSLVGNEIVSGKSFEFIELKNIGNKPINLSGLSFTSSITYQFKEQEVLAPKQFYVIASKPKWFYERHFMVPTGNFENNFSNSGEQVTISDAKGNPVVDFRYSDVSPWPQEADGDGMSLTAVERYPSENPGVPAYWKSSTVFDGTPFADDPGILDSIEKPFSNQGNLAVFPNPTRGLLMFRVDGQQTKMQVEISNLQGSLVYRSALQPGGTVNLRSMNLESGVYLVTLRSNSGTSVHKIVYNR